MKWLSWKTLKRLFAREAEGSKDWTRPFEFYLQAALFLWLIDVIRKPIGEKHVKGRV